MDFEALALAVDERVRTPAADRDDATLYAVRLAGGDLELEVLARGEARRLPQDVRPPAGVAAIALSAGAWAAPTDPDGSTPVRPSEHPDRWRVHVTTLVAGDGVDVSVIRRSDGQPEIMAGAVGLLHRRLVRCWARR